MAYILNALVLIFSASATLIITTASQAEQPPDDELLLQFDTCLLPNVAHGRVISLAANSQSSGIIPQQQNRQNKNLTSSSSVKLTFVLPGTEVFIFCHHGFRLIVSNNNNKDDDTDSPLICQPDGKWSRDIGKCLEINSVEETVTVPVSESFINTECTVPIVRNGDVFAVGNQQVVAVHPFQLGDIAPVGMRIRVVCHRGFQLPGPFFAEAICQQNQQWTSLIGPCNRIRTNSPANNNLMTVTTTRNDFRCRDEPPQIADGYVAPGTSEIGAKRLIGCRRGFVLHGLDVIECSNKGVWTRPGRCLLEQHETTLTCPDEPYVPNGQITAGGTNVGEIRHVTCRPGFILQGPDTIVCSRFGHWSIPGSCVTATAAGRQLQQPPAITSSPPDCGPVPIIPNGYLANDVAYFTGGSLQKKVRCQIGFQLTGPEAVFCGENGSWTRPGICLKNGDEVGARTITECRSARFVRNGQIAKMAAPTSDGRGLALKLKCDQGYTAMVSSDVTCDLQTGRFKALGYCLKDEYVGKLKAMRHRPGTDCLATDDDRIHFGYSWDRAPLLSDDSGCFNPKNQIGTEGSFWSLNYPCPYENRLTCVWDIMAPEGDYVAIAFNDIFFIEPGVNGSSDCQYDSVSFYVETTPLVSNNATDNEIYFELAGKFCGERRPKNMILQSSNIRVVFKTDNRYNGYGFRLVWASIRPSHLKYLTGAFF